MKSLARVIIGWRERLENYSGSKFSRTWLLNVSMSMSANIHLSRQMVHLRRNVDGGTGSPGGDCVDMLSLSFLGHPSGAVQQSLNPPEREITTDGILTCS